MPTTKLRYALGVVFGLALNSGAAFAEAPDTRILNAEDLAPLHGGKWVLASSMVGGLQKQGGIFAIEVGTGKAQQIYPNGHAGKSSMPDCPMPVAAKEFEPHGIALQRSAKGETLLYVVNHGERESIEIFAVEQHGTNTPALQWRGCIVTPGGRAANAVAVTNDGTVYMSNSGNPLDGSPPAAPYGGNVLAWTATSGWRDVPGSVIAGPNGLVISADGRYLYVASWAGSEVLKLALNTTGSHEFNSQQFKETRDLVKLSFHPDNLRWSDGGHILATGHLATGPEVGKCVSAIGGCENVVRSAIAEIDVSAATVRCTKEVSQNIATVAVNVGDELWVGTVRGENILRLPSSFLKCE